MARKNILDDLNGMITKVAADKAAKLASVKTASPGDGTPDGTKAPETGAQMASNKTEAAKGTAAMVDGGAETNKANESVKNSTEGATAVDPKGQSGAKGGDLAVKHEAANGASSIHGDDKKTASAKLAEDLRKAAAGYDQPQTNEDKNSIPAAKPDVTKAIDAGKEKAVNGKVANAADPFRTFLGTLKTAADASPVPAPAGGPDAAPAPGAAPAGDPAANSDQVIEELLKQIQSGAMTEEQAEKILNEAMKAGAIDPKMMAQAMDALHASGAPGDPAAAGAGAPPAAPAAPAPGPDAGAPAAPAGPDAGAGDPMAAAKLAMAEVGPEDPRYLAKLASVYGAEQEAGYAFGMKVGEALIKAANEMPPVGDGKDGLPPKADESAPKGPEAGHVDPMVDPAAAVKPEGEHEMAALKQLLDEMGIKPEELAELLKQHHEASKAPAEAAPTDPTQAKIAAFKKTAKIAIVKMAVEANIAAEAAHRAAAAKK